MILSQFEVDNADRVCLVAAMMVSNELEGRVPEGEVSRVSVPELGDFGLVTDLATDFIAKMHRESPDDWDGVVWYELFCQAGEGSLADRLVEYLIDWDVKPEDIRQIVVSWLKDIGI